MDDGDIEDQLEAEKNAYLKLVDMPDIDDDGNDLDGSDDEGEDDDELEDLAHAGQKRKSWSDQDMEEESEDDDRPRQRRRSNSVSDVGWPVHLVWVYANRFSSQHR
jgi:cell division control protein 45